MPRSPKTASAASTTSGPKTAAKKTTGKRSRDGGSGDAVSEGQPAAPDGVTEAVVARGPEADAPGGDPALVDGGATKAALVDGGATKAALVDGGATTKAALVDGGATKAAPRSKVASRPKVAVKSSAQPAVLGKARAAFLDQQRALLLAERATYTSQAEELKAQADSLALEHEPGDVQFDEEGGEGGTSNVDRELDLILSAQARATITEIDLATSKIDAGTYGICEQCGGEIPEARLQVLPHASLCVACKSGGLSSRR